jgi:thioredoxin reductase (NADPH)
MPTNMLDGTLGVRPAIMDAQQSWSNHLYAQTDVFHDKLAAQMESFLRTRDHMTFSAKEATELTGSGGMRLFLTNATISPLSTRAPHVEFVVLMMIEIDCDVVIVGGGPAGCTCAVYTSRADHKTVVLDKNPTVGALAITSTIANYPGVDTTMSGAALLDKMREQAVAYGTDYRRAQVFAVDVLGENKTVYTPEAAYHTKALVLASGAMGRKPTFKGEDTYLGKGVSYCATCDGAFYRDSEVCVLGTDQEAIEEAEFLTKFASTVHWITPTAPKNERLAQRLLSNQNVRQWKQTRLMSIEGDDRGVTAVQLKQPDSDTPHTLPVEGCFIYSAGALPITDFLAGCVETKEDGGVKVDEDMATNVPGVFAIGDIRNTPFKQVVVAASDGCIAAMSIDRYIKGRKEVRVDWVHK